MLALDVPLHCRRAKRQRVAHGAASARPARRGVRMGGEAGRRGGRPADGAVRASAGLARRRAARRAARPPCGGRKARRHARRLAARAGEGRLGRAGALSVAARCSTAVPASRKVREPRLRACGGPWGSVRLRRGSERPAGKAVRGAHHRALDAKESGGRRARSRSSASNEPVRSAAAVTVAVRRHAHIRGPSRYEAGIGGATLDMRRCTLAPRGLLGRFFLSLISGAFM